MKKLLQIDSCLGILSTGKITESIGRLASEDSWECYIAHGARYVGKSQMNSIQVTSKLGEYFHYAKSLLFDAHGLGSACETRKLIEKIDKINPDIIHLHCIHGYYLNYKLLFEYLATINTPVVWTFHDCWSMTGHCSHFDAIGCNRWQSECYDCPLKGEYPASMFMDASKRNFRLKKRLFSSVKDMTIVAVSQWLADIVEKSYMADYPIRVINNGVDVEVFQPKTSELRKKHGFEDKFVLIGVASVWDEMKGFNDFIKLSRLLQDDCRIVLIGLTRKQIEVLPQNIIGIERTENQIQLAEYYSMADVFVNPTYNDSFPTVNMEALACGTPVITYRTGGSPEILSEETGIVVEKGNLVELKSAIETIKNNTKKHYSAACRKRAVEKYNKNDRFEEYIELYNELIYKNY